MDLLVVQVTLRQVPGALRALKMCTGLEGPRGQESPGHPSPGQLQVTLVWPKLLSFLKSETLKLFSKNI